MSSFDTDSSRRQETVTETAPSRPRMDSLSPQAATGPLADSTPNSPTVPGPPTAFLDPTSLGVPIGSFRPPSSTASQPSTTPHSPISPATPTFPANTTSTRIAPTTRMSSRVSTVHLDGYERHELRVVDTPGLELGDDDPVKERERERGMMGLMRLLEERFEEVMREESRIVRRGTKGEDNLIHLGGWSDLPFSCIKPANRDDGSSLSHRCQGGTTTKSGRPSKGRLVLRRRLRYPSCGPRRRTPYIRALSAADSRLCGQSEPE